MHTCNGRTMQLSIPASLSAPEPLDVLGGCGQHCEPHVASNLDSVVPQYWPASRHRHNPAKTFRHVTRKQYNSGWWCTRKDCKVWLVYIQT